MDVSEQKNMSKEAILQRPMWNTSDIKCYLGVSYKKARAIVNEVNTRHSPIASNRQVPADMILAMFGSSRKQELEALR